MYNKVLNSLTSWRRFFSVDIQLANIFSTSAESESSREVWPLPSSYNAASGCDWENGIHIRRAAANVPLSCREQPTRGGHVVWSLGLWILSLLRRLKYEMLHRATDVTSQMTVNACDGHCCTERSIFFFFQNRKPFQSSCNFSACDWHWMNELLKAPISFVKSLRPSVHMYQLGYDWIDFRKIEDLWKSL